MVVVDHDFRCDCSCGVRATEVELDEIDEMVLPWSDEHPV
jgi:hypothetical protein